MRLHSSNYALCEGAQHLFELKDLMTEHYQKKLGVTVEVAKDSAPVPVSAQKADKALLQLTSVSLHIHARVCV